MCLTSIRADWFLTLSPQPPTTVIVDTHRVETMRPVRGHSDEIRVNDRKPQTTCELFTFAFFVTDCSCSRSTPFSSSAGHRRRCTLFRRCVFHHHLLFISFTKSRPCLITASLATALCCPPVDDRHCAATHGRQLPASLSHFPPT